MGPRFGALSVPEAWLPWHEAGVRCLFRGTLPAEADEPVVEVAQAVEKAGPVPAAEPLRRTAAPQAACPPVRPPAEPPARPETAPPAGGAPAPGRRPAPAPSVRPAVDPDAPWPAPWDAFLAKVPGTGRVIFTYLELGQDLAGQASDARRGLFRDIVGGLRAKAGWPAGAAAFWPLAAPGPGGGLTVDRVLFWRGVERLGPAAVCLFGRPAWEALFPGRRFVLGPLREGGWSLLVLPGPDDMLPDNRSAKSLAWNLLRSLDLSR